MGMLRTIKPINFPERAVMKRRLITLLVVISAMTGARASEFDGGFLGGRIGANRTGISGAAAVNPIDATVYGIEGGYNWDRRRYTLGVDAFMDSNSSVNNHGSSVYGLDVKLGLPKGKWLPYARLGYSQ